MKAPTFLMATVWTGFVAFLSLVSPSRALADGGPDDPVPLTLWNVQVRPGHPYIISIRTCQPRGISQGQILIRRGNGRTSPLRQAVVFSRRNDGLIQTSQAGPADLLAGFSSAEAGINEDHGPFLALLMSPDPSFVVGQELDLSVIAESTQLIDEDLLPSPFETLDGIITIIDESSPFLVEVTDLRKQPTVFGRGSDEVLVSVGTRELHRLSRAQIVLHYDPAVVTSVDLSDLWDMSNVLLDSPYFLDSAAPGVRPVRPARGDDDDDDDSWEDDSEEGFGSDIRSYLDTTEPGVIVLNLVSPRGAINLLPGPMVEFELELAENFGNSSLFLDPHRTVMIDRNGERLSLELRAANLSVVP